MKSFWIAPLALVAASPWSQALAQSADYRLGPQDQVEIRVSDLRAGTGEAYQWTAFNGTFTVGMSGKLSLPILGEVAAGDRTTADLARTLEDQLQAKVGLAKKPDAAIQIVKYRPIYVAGGVDKPGDYEYRPGLTVLKAISLAGGPARITSDVLLSYARDALSARGDLRVLEGDRLALLARQARLDAEVKKQDAIAWPAEVSRRLNEADAARLVREEQLLFETRRDALASQIASLTQSQAVLSKEIESLRLKEAALARQVALNQKELDQISGLVTQGIAVVPRQLAIEQVIGQFESDRLDAVTAMLRAQQDLSKAGRDILDLTNNRRSDALQEATEVRKQLAETNEKIATDQTLITHAEVRAPMAVAAAYGTARSPLYYLTRRVNGKAETWQVGESDEVEPGDVVRIEAKPPETAPQPVAEARQG